MGVQRVEQGALNRDLPDPTKEVMATQVERSVEVRRSCWVSLPRKLRSVLEMIDGLVGVFVMVGVTTFMAALVELGSFVLTPPSTLEGSRTS